MQGLLHLAPSLLSQSHLLQFLAMQIISFDGAGVTGHRNHKAISSAVQQLVESCGGAEDCPAAWKLVSAGSWQKYTSMLDALPAGPQRESVQTACYLNRGLLRSFRAFGAHWSQRRW